MHQNLWAPWRMSYLRQLSSQAEATIAPSATPGSPSASDASRDRAAASSGGSGSAERKHSADADSTVTDNFLAAIWSRPDLDDANHVVHRDADGMILLNRYPYANGHLLIALGEGRPRLLDYSAGQRERFWSLVDRATALCHQTLRPQGINIGINEGRAAGAGVPAHLHAHVVPRWGGDTNFMSVVGEIRVVPDALESMAAEYRRIAAIAI